MTAFLILIGLLILVVFGVAFAFGALWGIKAEKKKRHIA